MSDKDLLVSIDWKGSTRKIGKLSVYSVRGKEHYQFAYEREWVNDGFLIDPALQLVANMPYQSDHLWGAFQDISPDRWGRLVQQRSSEKHLSESDYMLGVSDHMRMGALRISDANAPDIYLSTHNDVPKLVHMRELEAAIQRMESGHATNADIAMLAQPGSSLGGARPKASIEDGGKLWIAKFQSNTDTERVSLWEATMLDLAGKSGIQTSNHRLLNKKSDRPILLVERFDRTESGKRTPFISAMTMLERNESNKDKSSYLELADAISRFSMQPKADKHELWKRMTFNAMTGNIDDHLRNHGFLHTGEGWRLSPAYDLNPTQEPFAKRSHNLSFDGKTSRPSLKLCVELAGYFDLTENEANSIANNLNKGMESWQEIAKHNGLHGEEIKRMEVSFLR